MGTGTDSNTGRGNVAMVLGIELSGSIPIVIGKGGDRWGGEGGDTSLGSLLTAEGGRYDEAAVGLPYRFGDPDKANEAGEDGVQLTRAPGGFLALGQGGWQHWRAGSITYPTLDGEGYGASSGSTGTNGTTIGHDGALVIRIKI